MTESLDFESRFMEALESIGREKRSSILAVDDDSTEEIETDEGDEEVAKEAEEKPLRPPTAINLFQHPDAHPYALDLALLRKYGPEWFEWEPETLEWRIPQDFRTTEVSDLNMDKIQAIKTLHVVDTYWLRWEVFGWCTMPFNGLFADFGVMQVPTYAQCAVSVDIANRTRSDVQWSDEVKGYISTVARHDGIFCPIDPVDFIEIDTEGLVVDCAEVQKLWPGVRQSGSAPTADTVTAEQLRRALTVHNYVQENRMALRDQLPMVLHA